MNNKIFTFVTFLILYKIDVFVHSSVIYVIRIHETLKITEQATLRMNNIGNRIPNS